ncbi:rod shape-determining protein RodA [Clostridium sp.]|uniref:rod shape-determining protein RodA n=1 Tax=Clostridium sp. TaxID=1506 RepID=UPI002FCBD8E6
MIKNFKINDKLIKHIDFGIIGTICMIVLFSIINIYGSGGFYYARLQFFWLIIGLVATYFILTVDYVQILNYAPIIYWSSVTLLLINDIFSQSVNGANAWIKIGQRAIQPGEFAKIGMILMIARVIQDLEGNINTIKNLSKVLMYAAIPMLLIVIQPDMGLTMVSFFIVLGILIVANLDWRVIVGGLSTVLVIVVGLWNSPLMPVYWKGRLLSFLNPEKFELTYGFQLLQSRIAIGSGGIFGLGFLNGKQYKFIPENHTDFIFAVINEEWGFLGAIFLLTLYGILLYKLITIAKTSKDLSGSIICIGVIASLLFSVIQNMGMTIGIMPITGITLPFVSYGGSSMLTNFISLALVLNVGMRRNKINF